MKRLLAAVAFGLALLACQGIDATAPNRYACDPKSALADGGNAGCPGGWRCNAVEGFCVDPDAGATQLCLGSEDCGGGWRCNAAEGRCFDPAVGAPTGCRGELDCADGWHCGAAGACNSLNVPAPYPCRLDGGDPAGQDCTAGWRCGLEGVCHDTSVPAAYVCDAARADAGDVDCEQGWRCGPDGRCVDSARDALLVNADAGAPSGAWEMPGFLDGQEPVHAAVSDTWLARYGCPFSGGAQTTADTVVFVTDAGLRRLVLYGRGGGNEWTDLGFFVAADGGPVERPNPDGGEPLCAARSTWRAVTSRLSAAPLPPGVSADRVLDVAQVDDGGSSTTWLLSQGGRVDTFEWLVDGGTWRQSSTLTFAPVRLHVGLRGRAEGLLAVGDAGVAVWDTSARVFVPVAPAAGPIVDVAVVAATDPAPSLTPTPYLHVARPGGVIDSAPLPAVADAGVWARRVIDPGTCDGGSTAVEIRGLRVLYGPKGGVSPPATFLLVWSHRDVVGQGGPHDELGFFSDYVMNEGDGPRDGTCEPLIAGGQCLRSYDGQGYGPPRELLLGYAPASRAEFPQVNWTHDVGDGGVDLIVRGTPPSPGCGAGGENRVGRRLEPFDSPARWFKSNPRRYLVVGTGGRLWVTGQNAEPDDTGPRNSGLPLEPLTPSARPDTVFKRVTAPLLAQQAVRRPTPAGQYEVIGPAVFAPDSSRAYLRAPWRAGLFPSGSVAGRPSWFFTLSEAGPPQPGFIAIDSREEMQGNSLQMGIGGLVVPVPQQPVRAATAPLRDGGALLVASMKNTLYAAALGAGSASGFDVGPGASAEDYPELRPVDVPLLAGSITSLVTLPPDPTAGAGAGHALGYVVASGRVFRFRADNPIVWRSDEVVLSPAEAVAVWADGPRVRAGFRDGTVYSLPSRAPVAPALTPGATALVDYAAVCGHAFALATTGLYRLVAATENQPGAWRSVPLAGAPGTSYGSWTLYTDGQGLPDGGAEVMLFGPQGEAQRVGGLRCLSP